MDIKTYRAKSMQEALALVRRELGSGASVLRTREVRPSGLMRWLGTESVIEVTASASISVPSRLPVRAAASVAAAGSAMAKPRVTRASLPVEGIDLSTVRKGQFRLASSDDADATGRVAGDRDATDRLTNVHGMPESLFPLFVALIEAEISEEVARQLVERVNDVAGAEELADVRQAKALVARMIEEEIAVAGPIQVMPGKRRLVALIGPTGVGKTTTIAKLAANFRIKQQRRVGLITVDTYRIAAVEQLRTYADIIDLPMEVVSTPREMRQAIARMANLDLVLLDTAGRSPKDDVKIQELKSMLAEAQPDDVQLVLSSVASSGGLAKTAEQFAAIGATALLITKLDEAAGLGNLLPLVRSSRLPLSYVTCGQNVPDDIEPADSRRLARLILRLEPE